jgi:hypothetical protein
VRWKEPIAAIPDRTNIRGTLWQVRRTYRTVRSRVRAEIRARSITPIVRVLSAKAMFYNTYYVYADFPAIKLPGSE